MLPDEPGGEEDLVVPDGENGRPPLAHHGAEAFAAVPAQPQSSAEPDEDEADEARRQAFAEGRRGWSGGLCGGGSGWAGARTCVTTWIRSGIAHASGDDTAPAHNLASLAGQAQPGRGAARRCGSLAHNLASLARQARPRRRRCAPSRVPSGRS